MMQLGLLILLGILQFLSGFGILALLKIYLKPALCFSLSILIGIAVFSFIPFLLQLAYVPLTSLTVFPFIAVAGIVLNLNSQKAFTYYLNSLKNFRLRVKLYEIPFLLIIALVVFVSVWRCYYYPPTPRDLTSGPELIAEYAVKEKTMINSVFAIDLSTTNNQFKPPFITSLQIIYKYAGFPFGQIWLSNILICFLVFLYHVLAVKLHKLIAGLLLVIFVAIPEMYAYTFMALFDYSNAVFFCLSLYFLFEFFANDKTNHLILSATLMAISTYIRSETLILAFLAIPAILFHYRHPRFLKNSIKAAAYFLIPSAVIYFLTITVYIHWYLPTSYNLGNLINKNILDPSFFYQRLSDMTGSLLFAGNSVAYYSYFVFVFAAVLFMNIFFKYAWNKTSLNWLFAIFVVYSGLPFIAHIFPLYDLDNSTKRGLFKLFPLMLLFMGNSAFLISVSDRIKNWDTS